MHSTFFSPCKGIEDSFPALQTLSLASSSLLPEKWVLAPTVIEHHNLTERKNE